MGYSGLWSVGAKGDYLGTYLEDFLPDFIGFLQEKSITSREKYAEKPVKINGTDYPTIQQAARDSMRLVFSMSSSASASFSERLSTIMGALSYLNFSSDVSVRDIYDDVIGDWGTLSGEKKMKYINYFWNLIEDSGAFEYLSDNEKSSLEKNWPTLADLIFSYTDGDWAAYPGSKDPKKSWAKGSDAHMMYTLTLMSFMTTVLRNHDPELNTAWARTYDSWYSESSEADMKEYRLSVADSYKPAAPLASAAGSGGGKTSELSTDPDRPSRLSGDQKIRLDVPDIEGEAVYYTLTDIRTGHVTAREQLCRGGVDLAADDGQLASYKLTAYARSYSKNSDAVSYYIDIADDRHMVIVSRPGSVGPLTYRYGEGEKVTVAAVKADGRVFDHWTVTDGGDETDRDISGDLFGSEADTLRRSSSVSFMMPEPGKQYGDYTPGEEYTLRFTAHYISKVGRIEAEMISAEDSGQVKKPEAGKKLPAEAMISFDNREGASCPASVTLPVSWTYTDSKGNTAVQPGGTAAFGETEYTAGICIPQDVSAGRYFMAEKRLSATLDGAEAGISKNDNDGSVTLTVSFDATKEGPSKPDKLIDLKIYRSDSSTGADLPPVTYKVLQNTRVTVTAPDIDNMSFDSWNTGASGISISETDMMNKTAGMSIPAVGTGTNALIITAAYRPVISAVSAAVGEPQAGKALSDHTSMSFTCGSKSYEVYPANISVSWSPSDSRAAYLTPYTASVSLRPDEKTGEGGTVRTIKVRSSEDQDWTELDVGHIAYSEDITAVINNDEAVCDPASHSVIKTFDALKYSVAAVISPDPQDAAYGTDPKTMLPNTVRMLLDDGREVAASVVWSEPEKTSGSNDPLDAASWRAEGEVKDLPDNVVNSKDISLKVSAVINTAAADAVSSPRASLESGTYLGDQVVSLSSRTDGAVIYYTSDGSDPSDPDNSRRKKYEGESIEICREAASDDELGKDGRPTGRKQITIRASASKEGMRTGAEGVYTYVFGNELTVPAAKELVYFKDHPEPQTGVEGGLFYTLKAVSKEVIIDEEGNASAVMPGTYRVRAKADKGFSWIIRKADGTEDTTEEDQIISFTITDGDKGGDSGGGSGSDGKAEDIEAVRAAALAELGKVKLSSYIEPERSRVKKALAAARKAIASAGTSGEIAEAKSKADKLIASQGIYDPKLPKLKLKKQNKKYRKSIRARWKKLSKKKRGRVSGIELYIARNKKFTKGRILKKAGKRRISKKIGRLSRKRTYYVKIRSWKKINGVKYVGRWSGLRRYRTR